MGSASTRAGRRWEICSNTSKCFATTIAVIPRLVPDRQFSLCEVRLPPEARRGGQDESHRSEAEKQGEPHLLSARHSPSSIPVIFTPQTDFKEGGYLTHLGTDATATIALALDMGRG